MTRGAASTSHYRGAVGETRSERVHYTCRCGAVRPVAVYRAVNAVTHPELAASLRTGEGVNVALCPDCGRAPVNVSVLYHDPERELLALVIPEAARHTELDERSGLLSQLAADLEYPVPIYAREFAVVFGGEGLADLLEAQRADYARREGVADLEQELAKRRALLEEDEAKFRASRAEFQRMVEELERRNRALEQRIGDLDRQTREMAMANSLARAAQVASAAVHAAPESPPAAGPGALSTDSPAAAPLAPIEGDSDRTPLPRPIPHEEIKTNPIELMTEEQLAEARREAEWARQARQSIGSEHDEAETDTGPTSVDREHSTPYRLELLRDADGDMPREAAGTGDVDATEAMERSEAQSIREPHGRSVDGPDGPDGPEEPDEPDEIDATSPVDQLDEIGEVVEIVDDESDQILASEPAPPETARSERPSDFVDDESEPGRQVPVNTETTQVGGGAADVALERWIVSREADFKLADETGVRLATSASRGDVELLRSERLNAKVIVQRLPSYPVVAIGLGGSAAQGREPY